MLYPLGVVDAAQDSDDRYLRYQARYFERRLGLKWRRHSQLSSEN